jgi:hypothetical protein
MIASTQRMTIMRHLQRFGTLNTLESREILDVLHPAARVMELRRSGIRIDTVWTFEAAHIGGKKHRVACYILGDEEVQP